MKTENKHSKIISAAIKVFAKKGFFSARISDIAKEAKVADGTIYLYFNNKNDILISIFEEELGKIVDKTKNLINRENDPMTMLNIFIEQHLLAMKKHKNLAEVIHIELRQADKVIKNYHTTRFTEYENLASDIIKKGQQQGIFRPEINPDVAKRIILGALDELARVWNTNYETHYSVDELSSQLLSTIVTGIGTGMG